MLVLVDLGMRVLEQGEPQRATRLLSEALQISYVTGDKLCAIIALLNMGRTAAMQGQRERAVRLMASGTALACALDYSIPPAYRSLYDRCLKATRDQLGEATFTRAWNEGQSMSYEDAVESALDESGVRG
jgi:non-specific serine/threonine protein kinase